MVLTSKVCPGNIVQYFTIRWSSHQFFPTPFNGLFIRWQIIIHITFRIYGLWRAKILWKNVFFDKSDQNAAVMMQNFTCKGCTFPWGAWITEVSFPLSRSTLLLGMPDECIVGVAVCITDCWFAWMTDDICKYIMKNWNEYKIRHFPLSILTDINNDKLTSHNNFPLLATLLERKKKLL